MRTPEITFQALLADWERLPDRVGDDWENLLPDIQRLIDAIATTDDEDKRALLIDELHGLLRPYKRAWRHLNSGMREFEQQRKAVYRGSSETDLTPTAPDLFTLASALHAKMPFEAAARDFDMSFGLEPEPEASHPSAPAVTRYTDISCPRRVWVETPRFSVIVRLTVEIPELSAAVLDLQVRADDEAPVLVQCSAPGFDLLSSPLQSTPVLPDADSPPLVFDLKPAQVGGSTISFDFFQYGEPLGTVSVPIETTSYEVAEGAEPRPPTSSSTSPMSPIHQPCVSPCCGMAALPGRPSRPNSSMAIPQAMPPSSTAASPPWPAATTPPPIWRAAPSALQMVEIAGVFSLQKTSTAASDNWARTCGGI